jgi:hypothetical protein
MTTAYYIVGIVLIALIVTGYLIWRSTHIYLQGFVLSIISDIRRKIKRPFARSNNDKGKSDFTHS